MHMITSSSGMSGNRQGYGHTHPPHQLDQGGVDQRRPRPIPRLGGVVALTHATDQIGEIPVVDRDDVVRTSGRLLIPADLVGVPGPSAPDPLVSLPLSELPVMTDTIPDHVPLDESSPSAPEEHRVSTCDDAAVLLVWITLSRVAEGSVTKQGGRYLDGDVPLPPYLAASVPTLLTEGRWPWRIRIRPGGNSSASPQQDRAGMRSFAAERHAGWSSDQPDPRRASPDAERTRAGRLDGAVVELSGIASDGRETAGGLISGVSE